MQRVDNPPSDLFENGDPTDPTTGTRVMAEWLNTMQEELAEIVEENSIVLDENDDGQVWEALQKAFAPIASGTIMLFGQNSAPTGWTRKADWQDNAMLCYAASGNIGNGGGVNPQATHTHTGPEHGHTLDKVNSTANHTAIVSTDRVASNSGLLYTVTAGGTIVSLTKDTTTLNGTGATGANTAPYYQEVIAATKD